VKTQPNYRVIRLETYCSNNKRGKPYLVFCENDDLNPAKAKAVCLYQNQWHALLISRRGIAAVGHPLPHVHQYDLDSPITTLEEAVGEPARPPTPDHDKEQPTSPTTETTSTPPPLQNQQL